MREQYHILIVEDHRELARILRTGIESLGKHFTAFDAPSGEEALLETHRHPIDLAIVDVRLPGMDGLEVARRLRNQQPQTKIFLISGQEEDALRAAAADIRADAWFRKPLELADLLDAMERTLGLVDSVLGHMPAPLSSAEEEKAVGRMSDLMADLRETSQARAVVLLNDMGQVVLQAGALDQQNLSQKALLTLISLHTTGVRLAHLLHTQLPRNHFYFHFENLTLHLTSVNAQYALMIVCDERCSQRSVNEFTKQLRATITGLQRIMERLGIIISSQAEARPSPVPEETPIEDESQPAPSDPLMALLEQELPQAEAEAFWETLPDAPSTHATNPDVITYEQARQLGLAPTDDV